MSLKMAKKSSKGEYWIRHPLKEKAPQNEDSMATTRLDCRCCVWPLFWQLPCPSLLQVRLCAAADDEDGLLGALVEEERRRQLEEKRRRK